MQPSTGMIHFSLRNHVHLSMKLWMILHSEMVTFWSLFKIYIFMFFQVCVWGILIKISSLLVKCSSRKLHPKPSVDILDQGTSRGLMLLSHWDTDFSILRDNDSIIWLKSPGNIWKGCILKVPLFLEKLKFGAEMPLLIYSFLYSLAQFGEEEVMSLLWSQCLPEWKWNNILGHLV